MLPPTYKFWDIPVPPVTTRVPLVVLVEPVFAVNVVLPSTFNVESKSVAKLTVKPLEIVVSAFAVKVPVPDLSKTNLLSVSSSPDVPAKTTLPVVKSDTFALARVASVPI